MAFVDIAGQPLDFELLFPDRGATTATDHPLSDFLYLLLTNLPGETAQQQKDIAATIGDVLQFLDTPISQYFDNAWAVDTVSSLKTLGSVVPEGRQPRPPKPPKTPTPPPTVRNNFIELVWSSIASSGGETFVIENSVNVPAQGQLQASVVVNNNQNLITLRYTLTGIDFNWSYTNFNQPGFDLTFDVQLDINIDLPVVPGDRISITTTLQTLNMDLSATDLSSNFDRILYNVLTGSDLGNGLFNNGSTIIDTSSVLNVNTLQGTLNFIAQAAQATAALGFTSVAASIPSNFLKIELVHPVDAGPQAWLTSKPPFPILETAAISTVAEASAGDMIQVACSSFPVAESAQLTLIWTDTTTGPPKWSDVSWGSWGGTQQNVRISRSGFNDGGNTYTATSLKPNTFYRFSVQDEDVLTMTPPSNAVLGLTSGSDVVSFYLVQGIQETFIGNATIPPNKSFTSAFTAPLTIPDTQPSGDYTLSAQQAGQEIASAPIHIVGQGDSPIPIITAADRIIAGNPMTVTFSGFNAGPVNVYIDSPDPPGISLGTTTSPGPDQTWEFTVAWPVDVPTQSVLYAQVDDESQPPASTPVTTLPIPQ
jgi:hypothetical protein